MADDTHFDFDLLLKVAAIGDSGVGKSCLLRRFVDDAYDAQWQPTIGVDLKIKTMELDGRLCKLQLWDTAGQERFRSLTWVSLRGVHGIAIVYDITDRASFEHATGLWWDEVEDKTGKEAMANMVMMLVGNKMDLPAKRAVSYDEAKAWADGKGIPFLETSAKDDTNVADAFVVMAQEIRVRVARQRVAASQGGGAALDLAGGKHVRTRRLPACCGS
uniref:Uncharacterized protein n=1 Tax=Chlamydomonas leiostraca TaxID=1034604 RepID=A0A7S0S3D2_9CHLO|mmetsp:Transcript_5436/g.13419  ORF Transcript_5436/g.13419 Transcript_5436/m.13419 type:complete len:217 (+) Transcript_5436:46-696(+)